MKNLFLLLTVFLSHATAHAVATTHGTISSNHIIQSRTFQFNPATMGTLGYASTGYTLPTGAYITKSYVQVATAFSPGATSGTLSIGCGTTGTAIKAAGTIGQAAGTFLAGTADGTVANYQSASACAIYANITGQGQLTGLLKGWIEYIVP